MQNSEVGSKLPTEDGEISTCNDIEEEILL
jgi:hypothetical protein